MTHNVINALRSIRTALVVAAGMTVLSAISAYAQTTGSPPPGPQAAPATGATGAVTPGTQAEVERVIVTGSNIPTAEETGPNPVDTYRVQDIEKLGVRNATD